MESERVNDDDEEEEEEKGLQTKKAIQKKTKTKRKQGIKGTTLDGLQEVEFWCCCCWWW